MRRHQFSFLSVYTAWKETHLALKYLRGEWKDGRDACRGHSFFLWATERETLAPLTGKMWHFLHRDTLHLQIDALSEIDRRRRNECASVTQRHATRTLWDLGSGAFWLVRFFKAQRASCLCYSNFSGVGENVRPSTVAGDSSLDESIHF